MPWEERSGRLYYYRKRREGKQVISEYVGAGPVAEAIAAIDEMERIGREQERELEKAEMQEDRAVAAEVDDLADLIRAVTHAALLMAGYHTHRGQWRQERD